MKLAVDAGGAVRTVEVRRVNEVFVVSMDGHEHTVDVNETGGIWSLLIGTKSYEVSFAEAPDGAMMVHVDGQAIEVSVESPGRGRGARRGGRTGERESAGPHRVVAPMPGKIVRVLVKPGDHVQARQGLIVVEAMKMENELRAPKAGTISEVQVAEGALVEAGTILVLMA